MRMPAPKPTLAQLEKVDPCFGKPPVAFVEWVNDEEKGYRILTCRAHGHVFLEDRRGAEVGTERLIFIGKADESEYESLWRKYHAMSDDALNALGIAL